MSKTLFFTVVVLPLVVVADKHHQEVSRPNDLHRKRPEYPEGYTYPPPHSRCGSVGCEIKMHKELQTMNLEIIKSRLLKNMGMETPPNITGKVLPRIPEHYIQTVEPDRGMMSDEPQFKTGYYVSEEDDEFYGRTEKVLAFAQRHHPMRHSWRGYDILYFKFSESTTKYHVQNATLFVYIKGGDRKPLPDVLIEVFKVYRAPDRPDAPSLFRVAAKKVTQPHGSGDWVSVDLTVTVSEWFKSARDNLGFVVNGTVSGKTVSVTGGTDNEDKTPYVEIETAEGRRRTRRNLALNCEDKMNISICCRYPLTVDFEQFNWDFIIAPKRYEANYCSGDCPFMTLQKNAHTHLLKMASPDSAAPCCAPRKLSAISMLYFDVDLNVVYGSFNGMVVDRCDCS